MIIKGSIKRSLIQRTQTTMTNKVIYARQAERHKDGLCKRNQHHIPKNAEKACIG